MGKITTSTEFANALKSKRGGEVIPEDHGLIIWKYGNKNYQVRVSETSISVNPPQVPIDGIVFLLSEAQIWGITDNIPNKKTLNKNDANMGKF